MAVERIEPSGPDARTHASTGPHSGIRIGEQLRQADDRLAAQIGTARPRTHAPYSTKVGT